MRLARIRRDDMGAPVAWFDITSKDLKRISDFYTQLFGWTLADSGQAGYSLVDTGAGGGAIGGGLGESQGPDDPGGTTIYMKVDDLQAYLDRAVELGGSVLIPPTPLPGDFGAFAMLADPEGHPVGLWG
jgi:predicted enzyme related to lactoylglutathione lyase